jgi:predicted MFS family arabinose efflux permease
MVGCALAMLVVAGLWLLLLRDRGQSSGHAPLAEALSLWRHPQLRRVAAMHFLLFGGYLAALGVLPRALVEGGMQPAAVGLAIAIWLGSAAFANGLGPWLSDRAKRRRPFLIAGPIVAASALGILALLPQGQGLWLLGLAALGGGAIAPLLLSLPLELEGVGPARAGMALGLLMLIGQAGGFLLPILVGAVAWKGSTAPFAILALAHLLILVPARGLPEPARMA